MDDLSQSLRDVWAGWSLEDDHQVLVGLTTRHIPPALANEPGVEVAYRQFTQAYLDQVIQNAGDRLNALLAPGTEPGSMTPWPYIGHVDIRGNRVDFTIDVQYADRHDEIEEVLADERVEGSVRVAYGVVPAIRPGCHTRGDCRPFRGGTEVDGSGSACTLGFVMYNVNSGIRRQSTASHCAGSPWNHNGVQIGPTAWTLDQGNVDFKVIHQNAGHDRAPHNSIRRANGTVAITLKMSGPGGQGVTVCSQGRFSNEQCGPVAHTNATVNGRSGFGRYDPPMQCQGDSGGPVHNASNNRAYGIYNFSNFVEGFQCVSGAVRSYFTWISVAEDRSGHQVLLAPTTKTLGPGQRMVAGDQLRSPAGAFTLNMQSDGNLVMRNSSSTAVWHTNTAGNSGAWAVMQADGNFVIYRANGTGLWSRPTSNLTGGSRLVQQDDGNLVIYTSSDAVKWHRLCSC